MGRRTTALGGTTTGTTVAVVCASKGDVPVLWHKLRARLQADEDDVLLMPLPPSAQQPPDELRFFTSMLLYLAVRLGGEAGGRAGGYVYV
jgi:hypothetical protein